MAWQIIGWSLFAAETVTTAAILRWLYRTGRRPWSWQQPLRVPKLAALSTNNTGDSDYVGLV